MIDEAFFRQHALAWKMAEQQLAELREVATTQAATIEKMGKEAAVRPEVLSRRLSDLQGAVNMLDRLEDDTDDARELRGMRIAHVRAVLTRQIEECRAVAEPPPPAAPTPGTAPEGAAGAP